MELAELRSAPAGLGLNRNPMDLVLPRLYAILDASHLADRSLADVTESLLRAGVRLIQYRNKRGSSRELFDAAVQLAPPIRRAKGIFIMNDRADVAWAAKADGVHLGQEDLPVEAARAMLPPGTIIGISTHCLAQVEEANRSSADYIAFGPVFETRSKDKPGAATGLAALAEARKVVRKPLVAIGGITPERARSALEAGADSVAVIHALMSASDPGEPARQFLEAIVRAR